MGAIVYSCPAELPEPRFEDYPLEEYKLGGAYERDLKKHTEALSDWCRSRTPNRRADSPIGEVIRWQVADGYAQYMVYTTSPLALIHLDYLDGYEVSEIMLRGLRVSDVKQMIARERRLSELFGARKGRA